MYYLSIKEYATVSLSDSVIVFGGYTSSVLSSQSNVVAEFKNGRWDQIGELMQSRYGHSAIEYGGRNLVVGGFDWRYDYILSF